MLVSIAEKTAHGSASCFKDGGHFWGNSICASFAPPGRTCTGAGTSFDQSLMLFPGPQPVILSAKREESPLFIFARINAKRNKRDSSRFALRMTVGVRGLRKYHKELIERCTSANQDTHHASALTLGRAVGYLIKRLMFYLLASSLAASSLRRGGLNPPLPTGATACFHSSLNRAF